MHIKLHKPEMITDDDIMRRLTVLRTLPVLGTKKIKYVIVVDEINRANHTWQHFEDFVDMKRLKELLNTRKKITIEE